MKDKIVLSRHDALRLRSLLAVEESRKQNREHLEALEGELDRALLVDRDLLPSNRVAVNSTVAVRDIDADLLHTYTLVLPKEANPSSGRISVLAPLATALLGFRTGSEVVWKMPGGVRRLKIEAVRSDRAEPRNPEPTLQLTA